MEMKLGGIKTKEMKMGNDEWCLFDGDAERYEYEVMRELEEEFNRGGAEMMSEAGGEGLDEFNCADCGEVLDMRRAKAGYVVCKECGDTAATQDRKKWTVVQEYGKGGYQYITPQAAHTTLKQTNQKQPRD